MRKLLAVLAVAALDLVEAPDTRYASSGTRLKHTVAKRRKRSGLPQSGDLRQPEQRQPEDAPDELFVQRDGTMLSAGTLSSPPAVDMVQRPRPSDTELGGMIALFDECVSWLQMRDYHRYLHHTHVKGLW